MARVIAFSFPAARAMASSAVEVGESDLIAKVVALARERGQERGRCLEIVVLSRHE